MGNYVRSHKLPFGNAFLGYIFTVMELSLRKISTFGDAIIPRGILKKAGTAKEGREGRNFINKKATKGH